MTVTVAIGLVASNVDAVDDCSLRTERRALCGRVEISWENGSEAQSLAYCRSCQPGKSVLCVYMTLTMTCVPSSLLDMA